ALRRVHRHRSLDLREGSGARQAQQRAARRDHRRGDGRGAGAAPGRVGLALLRLVRRTGARGAAERVSLRRAKLVALATIPGVFRAPRTPEEAETERWTMASFGLVFPTLIGWVLAGWLLVAMPLGAAFSRHSTWLTVLAQIAWLAGAPLLGRFLAKRAR